jgi:hypothetical protein
VSLLKAKALHISVVLSGALLACVFVASLRTALELLHPTYSGFGPWRPFVELPTYILSALALLSVVQLIAMTVRRALPLTSSRWFSVGVICGLVTVGVPIQRAAFAVGISGATWLPPLLACIASLAALALRLPFQRRGA